MRHWSCCYALVGLAWLAANSAAQDKLPGEPPWVEQFDGKTLQGWEIAGQSVVENGTIKLGGDAAATLRLQTPLGDRFSLKLEFQCVGPIAPVLQWATDAPVPSFWQFPQIGGSRWADLTVQASQGKWFSSNSWSFSVRALDNTYSNNGGLTGGTGPVRDLMIVVNPGTTLLIRRLVLQTTPPAPVAGLPWTSIAVLVGLVLAVIALGWLLNRRRAESPSSRP